MLDFVCFMYYYQMSQCIATNYVSLFGRFTVEILCTRVCLQYRWCKMHYQLVADLNYLSQHTMCHVFTKAYLRGTEVGSTVDQVEILIKKHDAFESLLAKQDAKVINSAT